VTQLSDTETRKAKGGEKKIDGKRLRLRVASRARLRACDWRMESLGPRGVRERGVRDIVKDDLQGENGAGPSHYRATPRIS